MDRTRDLASLAGEETIFGGFAAEKLKRLQAELEPLSRRYDVVVANPPYMGSKNMNKWLGDWIKTHYKDVKGDLFSCFMVRNVGMGAEHAQLGFMTPYVWMFIGTYEKLRKFVIQQNTITSLIQLEYSGFSGATVPICTFTVQKGYCPGYRGGYVRLSDFVGADQQAPRALEALANHECGWFYRANASGFEAIPGSPIAYWASNAAMGVFSSAVSFGELANPSAGITTGDNASYIHYWWEEEISNISFTTNDFSSRPTDQKWFPCNKGGAFRKWYGNRENVMAFDDSAINAMRKLPGYRPVNIEKQFKASISWSDITSGRNSFRANGSGNLYDHVGISAFPDEESFNCLLAFLNTSVASTFMILLAPTLHCNAGDLAKLPIVEIKEKNSVNELVNDCIKLCRRDWDAFELSWAFRYHPMI